MDRRRFLLMIAAQSATWQDEAFSPLNGSLAPTKAKGPFKLGKLIGRTLAVNQCLNYSGIISFPTTNGISCTISNGTLHYQGTATANGYMGFISSSVANQSTPSVQGHKYAFLMNLTGSIGTGFFSSASLSYTIKTDSIYTATSGTFYGQFRMIEGETYDFYIKPKIHDLTLMFGPGKEPTTIDEFKKVYSRENTAYTLGQLESSTITSIIAKPYNLFDGELFGGYWNANTGEKTINSAFVGSDDYIKVTQGRTYNLEIENNPNIYRNILGYDANKNFIRRFATPTSNSATITIPNDVRYITFYYTATQGNVCFHLTGIRTGYAPQKQTSRLELPNDLTIKSALDAKDTFEIVGENAVFTKNVGTVDLGTLTWSINNATNGRFIANYNNNPNIIGSMKILPNLTTIYNAMSSKYITTYWQNIGSNVNGIAIFGGSGGGVFICDVAYANQTAETFKAAMSGQYLNYELATPQTITIPMKKLQAVTIGELSWFASGSFFFSIEMNDLKANSASTNMPNVYCSEFMTDTYNNITSSSSNNVIGLYSTQKRFAAKDTSCATVADFVSKHRDDVIWFESVNDQAEWNAGTCDAVGEFETGYVSPDAVLKIYERK